MNRNQAIPRRMSRAMRYVDKLTLAMKAVFRPDLNRAGDLKRTESTIAVAAHDCRGAGARASAPSGCKLRILFAIVEPLVRLDDHASCRTLKPSPRLRGAGYSSRQPIVVDVVVLLARVVNRRRVAVAVASFVLAASGVFGRRSFAFQSEPNTSFRDWGYLTSFLGTWMLGGYLIALPSRWGLRKAIAADW